MTGTGRNENGGKVGKRKGERSEKEEDKLGILTRIRLLSLCCSG